MNSESMRALPDAWSSPLQRIPRRTDTHSRHLGHGTPRAGTTAHRQPRTRHTRWCSRRCHTVLCRELQDDDRLDT